MIGTDQQAIVTLLLQPSMQRTNDMMVDILHRSNLLVNVPFMRCLIGRFHMHDHEIDVRA